MFDGEGLQGWASGIPTDSEDTLRFAEIMSVRPMIEKYPLAKAAEAYARMMSEKAEFRDSSFDWRTLQSRCEIYRLSCRNSNFQPKIGTIHSQPQSPTLREIYLRAAPDATQKNVSGSKR